MKTIIVLIAISITAAATLRDGRSLITQSLALPQEKHLRNLKQLTFGGENAEAYFSSDGQKLIFQSTRDGRECDQIYTMNIDGSNPKVVADLGNSLTIDSITLNNAAPAKPLYRQIIWEAVRAPQPGQRPGHRRCGRRRAAAPASRRRRWRRR